MDSIKEDIIKYSKELKLPVFRRDFEELARKAAVQRIDYEAYLLGLLEREFELRLENRKKAQIRQAGFPFRMYLTNLEGNQLPLGTQEKLPLLKRLDFIRSARNIILAGNPGTGKNSYSHRA